MDPPEPAQLAATLGDNLSTNTREASKPRRRNLRAALILGSPEFMVR